MSIGLNENITLLINTFNEEKNIKKVLNNLLWIKKIIIVDSQSSDGTLDIVRKFRNPVDIFKSVEDKIKEQGAEGKGFDWQEIFELFHKPDVLKIDNIEFPKLDEKKVKSILMENDFSEERIDNQLLKLHKGREERKQKTLF